MDDDDDPLDGAGDSKFQDSSAIAESCRRLIPSLILVEAKLAAVESPPKQTEEG